MRYITWDILLLFSTLLAILIFSSRTFGVTWDETIYFDFAASIKEWFRLGPSFEESALDAFWAYDSFANPHPPFMKILSAITSELPGPGFPTNYRLGHFIFCSAALTLLYILLKGKFSRVPALCAVGFVFLQPRLFGHMLNGGVDSPVAMAWLVLPLLAWKISGQERISVGKKELLFCLIYGFAVGTKFTGLLVIIPLSLYFLLLRKRSGLLLCLGAFLYGLLFLVIVSPEKWHHPLKGISEYLLYPFTRESIPIETFYLWETYPFFLPWHYFDLMTFFTFPALLWFLLPGLAFAGKREFSFLLALLLPIFFWVILGHFPKTPRHDVVRQFISLFPLLGVLSWFGLYLLLEFSGKKRPLFPRRSRNLALTLPVFALGAGMVSIHPFELSYFNSFTGGLKGAEKRGLEISYYLEAVNPEALGYINTNLPVGAGLTIFPPWTALLRLYKSEGLIREDIVITTPVSEKRPDYRIVVRRRAMLRDEDYQDLSPVFEIKHDEVSLVKIIPVKRKTGNR